MRFHFIYCISSVAAGILFSMSIWSCAQVVPATPPGFVAPLRPLLQALDQAKVSASLEFSGRQCDRPLRLPNWRSPRSSGGSPLEVVRETFVDNPNIHIKQDPDGTIRI